MQSSMVSLARMFWVIRRKHFDTSGKSPAQFYHHAICKMPMVLPDNGLFGAIAGKIRPTGEVAAPARARRGGQAATAEFLSGTPTPTSPASGRGGAAAHIR